MTSPAPWVGRTRPQRSVDMTATARRSRDIWLVALAALLLGACGQAPQVIPLTPPPIRPDSEVLTALDWTSLVVPGGGDVYRIERVAANETDVVTIGYDEAGPGEPGCDLAFTRWSRLRAGG